MCNKGTSLSKNYYYLDNVFYREYHHAWEFGYSLHIIICTRQPSMNFDLKSKMPDDFSQVKGFPSWNVKLGKVSDNEWGANVEFSHITGSQWNTILELVETYSKIRWKNCPAAYGISESNHRIQFRFGHCVSKPTLITDSKNISPEDCESYRDQLIECAEVFHNHGLGFWWLDRQLLWQVDGNLLFIPVFWFSAFGTINALQLGMPPEYFGNLSRPLSQVSDIYAIASFCFRALTGKEHDPGNPLLLSDIRPDLKRWDAVLDPALRKTPSRRPASFGEWKQNKQINRRKRVKTILIIFLLVLVGGYFFRPKYFERGTGSYVVQYANCSYNGAQWERVWPEEGTTSDATLYNIGGWDKNHLAVGGSDGIVFRNGQPICQDFAFSKPYFTNKTTFYAFDSDTPTCVDRFVIIGDTANKSNPKNSSYSFSKCNAGYNFCQLNRYYFQFWGQSARDEAFLYEYTRGEFTMVEDEKKNQYAMNLEPYHSFRNGRALAFQPHTKRIVRYRNGLWYEHHETAHEDDKRYGRNRLWAMDEENFILVSNSGMITQFRKGSEDRPETVDSLKKIPYLAVWGRSMDKFWVLDSLGNVVLFDNTNRPDRPRWLIRGPELNGDYFIDAWVSPEGVVYAITEKEVYRLD